MTDRTSSEIPTCAVPKCTAHVLPDKLMCVKHWRRVPLVLQFAVYRRWATLSKARKPNLRLAAARAYRDAREAAIKAVSA